MTTAPEEVDRAAARHAVTDQATREARRHGWAVVLGQLGAGSAVLAVRGTVDHAAKARLQDVVTELEHAAVADLVVDLDGVRGEAVLTRALGRVRVRLLAAGIRVQWYRVPEDVTHVLHGPATEPWSAPHGEGTAPHSHPGGRTPGTRKGAVMGADDKAEHKGEELKGKAKEAVGQVTGDEELEAQGKGDQVKGNVKQAGDKVKDAVKGS